MGNKWRQSRTLPIQKSQLAPEKQKRELIIQTLRTEFSFFSGPLPSPERLEAYDRVLPGAAERIFRMTERTIEMADKQSDHRQGLETAVVRHNIKKSALGQWMAFALALGGIYIAGRMIEAHMSGWAVAAVLGAFGSLVAVAIYGHKQQKSDLAEKQRQEKKEREK